jgi:hypothetical protein
MAKVSVDAAQQRLGDVKVPLRVGDPRPDRAHPGDQSGPVGEENENKDRGKKPKRFADQFVPEDAIQELV